MLSEFQAHEGRDLVTAVATAVGLRSKNTPPVGEVPAKLPPELAPWYLPGPDPMCHEGHAVLVVSDVSPFEDVVAPYRLDFVALDRLMAVDGWHIDGRGMVRLGPDPDADVSSVPVQRSPFDSAPYL